MLTIWDLLFAENLNLALIDMTCVAMLLRVRWKLMRADYSSALTILLRYPAPTEPFGPSTLVQDAIQLEHHKSTQTGAELIGRYTGRRPDFGLSSSTADVAAHRPRPATRANRHRYNLSNSSQDSLIRSSQKSPARFQQYQKGLETAFQEVSGTLQKRAEGWGISKTVREVRGAVGEIRRNFNEIQSASGSPNRSLQGSHDPLTGTSTPSEDLPELSRRLEYLEDRNKALAKMLGDVIEELRAPRTAEHPAEPDAAEGSLNVALAKMQFVQVYLDDSEIPIPPPIPSEPTIQPRTGEGMLEEEVKNDQASTIAEDRPPEASNVLPEADSTPEIKVDIDNPSPVTSTKPNVRPSLAQSSFSWMLGEDRHRSSFVSSVSVPPEQRRDSTTSDTKPRPKQLFVEGKKDKKDKKDKKEWKDRKEENRRGSDSSEEDGFTLNSLRGRSPAK